MPPSHLTRPDNLVKEALRGTERMQGKIVIPPKDYEIKNRIADGVDRPIAETTVEIICRNSGVSRPTFYRHFDSKFDLAFWYATFAETIYLDEIGRSCSWEEGLTGHFRLLFEERDLFYFTSFPSNEEKARRTAMQAHRGQVVLQKLGERGVEVTSDMSYYVEAYVAVETTMSARWMRNRMDRSPEEMGHLLSQCVPRPLFEALEL